MMTSVWLEWMRYGYMSISVSFVGLIFPQPLLVLLVLLIIPYDMLANYFSVGIIEPPISFFLLSCQACG